MIKRIELLCTSELERWLQRATSAVSVPPLRAAVSRVVQGSAAPHDAIGITWFQDLAAMRSAYAHALQEPGTVIIAEEHVLRGADWLEQRWLDRTPKYKHMALARRAAGLSATEFSERWRNRPGRIGSGTSAQTLEIPAAARGHAYVQNHPVHGANEALYDAINEVYFDDIASMQSRIAFFADHNVAHADADLVSEALFVVVEEHPLP